jgi:hypothetical protein
MSAEAKAHLVRGAQLFEAGAFADAIAELKAGHAIDPHPDFLYAQAQAERKRGNCVAAIDLYRAFLHSGPPADEAERAQANLDRCEEAIRLTAADRRAAAEAFAPRPPPGPPARPRPWYHDTVGNLLAGAGLLAGAAAGVAFWAGDQSARAANAPDATLADVRANADTAARRRAIGVIGAIGGGLLLTAGIVRYALRPRTLEVALGPGAFAVAIRY